MAQRSVRRQATHGGQWLFVLSLAFLFLIISGGIGYALYRQVRDWVSNSDTLPVLVQNEPGEGIDWAPGQPLPTWEGTDRVNILVMGIDERESEDGPWRTDTMLVLTIDPLSKSAGMLSIPRDLWVPFPVPDYGDGRINTANYLGDLYDYPGGGPALARDTVEYNLGIRIQYYVRVNFRTFVELVDQIGGIDIYVEEEINDPLYPSHNPADPYGYEPLYIPAGWVHMDGDLALRYARTRHSNGGDFDRARRQQQVLLAAFDKVTRLDMLPQLVSQAPQMWETINNSVVTNLSLDEIVRLANLATQIPAENIQGAVIDEECTMFWETPDGQQVLVPVRDCMRQLRDRIFTTQVPTTQDDTAARLAEEAATVEVRNGTITSGLAQSTADYLTGQGIDVATYGNADRFDYAESLIIVNSGKTFTAGVIAQLLNLPPTAVVDAPDSQAGVDIVVILGADYQPATP